MLKFLQIPKITKNDQTEELLELFKKVNKKIKIKKYFQSAIF